MAVRPVWVRKVSVIFDQTLSLTTKPHSNLTLFLTLIVINIVSHINLNNTEYSRPYTAIDPAATL